MKPKKKSLNKGSVYCKKCGGIGLINLTFDQAYGISGEHNIKNLVCPKCHGDGQFDWIEQVVGKRKAKKKIYMAGGQHLKFPLVTTLKLSARK